MKYAVLLLFAAMPLHAEAKVKIATVPSMFTPYAGSGEPERVSMSGFYFEVNQETKRARVVVDYTYPDDVMDSGYDGHRPSPTYARVRGLRYDPAAHSIVYNDGREKPGVCAVV